MPPLQQPYPGHLWLGSDPVSTLWSGPDSSLRFLPQFQSRQPLHCAHCPYFGPRSGTNGVPSKDTCLDLVNVILFGKGVSAGVIELRIILTGVGPKSSDKRPYKKTEDRTQRPCDDEGRACRDVATGQGCLGPPELEEAGRTLLYTFRGSWPCRHLGFRLLASRVVRGYTFVVSRPVVIIRYDPRKPTPLSRPLPF